MPSNLLRLTQQGPVQLIELLLPEQLDHVEFNTLNDAIAQAISEKPDARWLLDLTHVTYMGSAVLGLMVNIRQWIKQGGGKLILCGMSPRLTQIFQTCSMQRLFLIRKTRSEALRDATP